jgi:hypothetical protein
MSKRTIIPLFQVAFSPQVVQLLYCTFTHMLKRQTNSFVPRGFQPATCEIFVLYPHTHAKKKNHYFVPRWLIDMRTIQVQSPHNVVELLWASLLTFWGLMKRRKHKVSNRCNKFIIKRYN